MIFFLTVFRNIIVTRIQLSLMLRMCTTKFPPHLYFSVLVVCQYRVNSKTNMNQPLKKSFKLSANNKENKNSLLKFAQCLSSLHILKLSTFIKYVQSGLLA